MAQQQTIPEFAIIGASPAGYTFALSLLQQRPDLKPSQLLIIESNAAGRRPGGPFFLTPNSLRLLDKFKFDENGPSIYEQIRKVGYNVAHHTIRDEHGKFLGAWDVGHAQRWGYDGLRIERGVVLKILEAEIQRLGIPVAYDTSFREVVEETGDGVAFRVRKRGGGPEASVEGEFVTWRARRLVGADGVHSRTRTYVCGAEVLPAYTGNFMAAAYLRRAAIAYDADFRVVEERAEHSLSITTPQGTLMLIPSDHDAAILQLGRQWPGPDLGRAGWEALHVDKKALWEKFTEDKDKWSGMPNSVLNAIREEDIWGVWPFYLLPKLKGWISEIGKVVIIGDAAHTLIPAAAQGANQAFEDAWTLAKAYGGTVDADGPEELAKLKAWEEMRMKKLEKVSKLSVQLMNVRLPPEEQAKLPPDMIFDLASDEEDRHRRLDWLYGEDKDLTG